MSVLWIGNFSFEDQLLYDQLPSAQVLRLEAELSPCLAGAATADDFILCPQEVESSFSSYLQSLGVSPPSFVTIETLRKERIPIHEIRPWGWTEAIRKMAEVLDVYYKAPSEESVCIANSRTFSHQLSQSLECQLPGETIVQSHTELMDVLQSNTYENGFVLKMDYGQSGRGQIISESQQISTQHLNWALKRLKSQEKLFLEPKLRSVNEFGIQWEIVNRLDDPKLLGITLLQSARNGSFTASKTGVQIDDYPELQSIVQKQNSALKEIQKLGYFGPVGIDAMIYLDELGNRSTRPLQDINARWTMGKLAMLWAQRCFPNRMQGSWIHSREQPHSEAILTSPEFVGGRPVQHKTWCLP